MIYLQYMCNGNVLPSEYPPVWWHMSELLRSKHKTLRHTIHNHKYWSQCQWCVWVCDVLNAVCFCLFDVVLAFPSSSQLTHCCAQTFDETLFFSKESVNVEMMLGVNCLRNYIKNQLPSFDWNRTEWKTSVIVIDCVDLFNFLQHTQYTCLLVGYWCLAT